MEQGTREEDNIEEVNSRENASATTSPETEVVFQDENEGSVSKSVSFQEPKVERKYLSVIVEDPTMDQQPPPLPSVKSSGTAETKVSFASGIPSPVRRANPPATLRSSAPLLRRVLSNNDAVRGWDKSTKHMKMPGQHVDLATGAVSTRCQYIRTVGTQDQIPMKHRFHTRLAKMAKKSADQAQHEIRTHTPGVLHAGGFKDESEQKEDGPPIKQYRITSKPFDDTVKQSWMQKSNNFRRTIQQGEQQFVSWLSTFLHWAFRANFFHVFVLSFVLFMMLITFFAILVYWIDRYQPECIVGVDREPSEHIKFGDAYHLSWTTLSTVGYGIIAPGLPATTVDQSRCAGINMLMAFESFVGVLFGGITGAVIFAKIARIQSIAPVAFSDPVVVRYGTGCIQVAKDQDTIGDIEISEVNEDEAALELPCPILEFRMVNTMWNQKGGEIMDAGVMLVVSRLETTHEVDKRIAKNKVKRKGKPRKPKQKKPVSLSGVSRAMMAKGSLAQRFNQSAISSATAAANALVPKPTDSNDGTDGHEPQEDSDEHAQPFNRAQREAEAKQKREMEEAVQKEVHHRMSLVADAVGVTQPQGEVAVDEGVGDHRLAPRRIFHTLEVQTDSHPFFRRTWNIRHVCDENSPLLPSSIRARIAENNGFWPSELNSYDAVRKAINFYEIIVSFSGTANVSGSSVYSQKIYQYVDMTVGYTFVNVLAKNKEGKIYVDTSLLNDVKEQRGGGAEPIAEKDLPIFAGYSSSASALHADDEDIHDEKKEGEDMV